MIYRTFDPTLINRIANRPVVRATVGLHIEEGIALDFSEHCDRPDDYIVLTNGIDAVSLYEQRTPVCFDGHSIFDVSCRGRDAVRVGRQMLDWVFVHTLALIVTGGTPTDFRAARWFNRQIGMSSDGIRELIGVHWTREFEYFHITRGEWEAGSNNIDVGNAPFLALGNGRNLEASPRL